MTIKKYVHLLKNFDLTYEEKFCVKFLYFNPSLLLILDDCASQVDKWGKDNTINKLFFEGRWMWITSIYTMQDDKKLATGIRKKASGSTSRNC